MEVQVKTEKTQTGCGGLYLQCQHLGGWARVAVGMWTAGGDNEFETNLSLTNKESNTQNKDTF